MMLEEDAQICGERAGVCADVLVDEVLCQEVVRHCAWSKRKERGSIAGGEWDNHVRLACRTRMP